MSTLIHVSRALALGTALALSAAGCGGSGGDRRVPPPDDRVAEPPVITQHPVDRQAVVGQRATFSVAATGSGLLSFQWLRNDEIINGAVGATYETPLLALGDTGTRFNVRVTDSKGSRLSTAGIVTVGPAAATDAIQLAVRYGDGTMTPGIGAVPAGGGAPVILEAPRQAHALAILLQGVVAEGSSSNLFTRAMLYWKNGLLFRSDFAGAGGVPVTAQVSTVTWENRCERIKDDPGFIPGNDVVNAMHSWYVVHKQGADKLCETADDEFLAVRLDMGSGDAPRKVLRPVATIHSAQGAVSGWLVRNGLDMQRVNADFTNPVTLFTLPSADARFIPGAELSNTAVFSTRDAVYLADLTAPAPVAVVKIATLGTDESVTDVKQVNQRELVLAVSDSTRVQTRVLRHTFASAASNAIGSAPGFLKIDAITPTRVLLSGSNLLVTFPLTGGAPTELYKGAFMTGRNYAGGERIWFTLPPSAGGWSVRSVNSDGTGEQSFAGSELVGCALRPQTAVFASLRDCDAAMVLAGASLRSYDARSGELRHIYGNIDVRPQQTMYSFSPVASWGQFGILTQVLTNPHFTEMTYVNYVVKTDQPGLTQVVLP